MLNIFQYRNGLQILPVTSLALDEMGELQVLLSDGKLYYHDGTIISPVVTEAGPATLTNKIINAVSNSVANIVDANISLTAAINASKIANGSVSNIEFQFLDGVTSSIQVQLNTISGSAITSLTGDVTATGPGAATVTIAANAVTNAQLAQMAAHTFKGNNTGSTGDPLDLTQAQLTAELNLFTSALQGLVPASGGGTTNFLRADGTFSAPPGTGGTVASIGTINSETKSANGLVISGSSLVAQTADSSFPGMVSITSQSFSGSKGFLNGLATATINDLGSGLSITVTHPSDLSLNANGSSNLILNADQGVSIKEITTPSNPSSGFSKAYFKTDHNLYSLDQNGNEKLIGSGSGGGVNFIGLNTTFQPLNINDTNAEASIGNWAAYADAAGVAPVDMTGGSPVVTIARTTTVGEVLNGSGSFKVVKDAANRQGNGVSVIANIPLGFRGTRVPISSLFKIISGSLVFGDLKLYAYDITNSQVITPDHNDVVGSGTLTAAIDIPSNTTQIRFGFHFASTSTAAVTFVFDDIAVGPAASDSGGISSSSPISDWIAYTPTFTGFGTPSNVDFWYKRVGDSIMLQGYWTPGTPTATLAQISLPNGLSVNPTWAGTVKHVGRFTLNSSVAYTGTVLVDSSHAGLLFSLDANASFSGLIPQNADAVFGANNYSLFTELIPVVGWSSNSAIAPSGILRISDILANGTRVTTVPTLLGEYRTLIKDNAATTLSDNAPTLGPSSTNGMKIFSVDGTGAGTSGEPNAWHIFIGQNKSYRVQYYSGTGRTGRILTDYVGDLSSIEIGLGESYDPTLGILSIYLPIFSTAGTRRVGMEYTSETDDAGSVMNGYFDVIVADNEFQIQLAQERSEIWVTGSSGGLTNLFISSWSTTIKSVGSDITRTIDLNLGDTFTINTAGLYSINYSNAYSAAAAWNGLSLNSSQLTTEIYSINAADRLAMAYSVGAVTSAPLDVSMGVTAYFSPGDIIRAHNSINSNSSTGIFHITKVSN